MSSLLERLDRELDNCTLQTVLNSLATICVQKIKKNIAESKLTGDIGYRQRAKSWHDDRRRILDIVPYTEN